MNDCDLTQTNIVLNWANILIASPKNEAIRKLVHPTSEYLAIVGKLFEIVFSSIKQVFDKK